LKRNNWTVCLSGLLNEVELRMLRALVGVVRKYWIVLSLMLLVAITALSLWPVDKLPTVPGSDKSHHFLAYLALMFPAALRQPRYWLWIGLLYIGWSAAIELLQPSVNRYAEWWDMLANGAGVACGGLAGRLVAALLPAAIPASRD